MGIIAAVRRLYAAEKLRAGQCKWCEKPLRDDELSSFCSDDCHRDHEFAWAI